MKKLKKELVKTRWIIQTRKVGRAQMYKLNLKSKKVQKFIDFFWSVVNEEVDKQLGKEEKSVSFTSSRSVSLPVSAQHI
jgi:hypothetical protein